MAVGARDQDDVLRCSGTERIVGRSQNGRQCVVVAVVSKFQSFDAQTESGGVVEESAVDGVWVGQVVNALTAKSDQCESVVVDVCGRRGK